jgi:starvation-inducible DNA-binding protein
MPTSSTRSHLPPLSAHACEEVGSQLQATLVELIDLALVGKQLHWSIVGPLFRSLHLQLDELIDSWRELADTVAERALAIGFWPNGQVEAIAQRGEERKVEPGAVEDEAVVRELARRLLEIDGRARTRADRLGELDAASQDVMIEVVRALEQQLWTIRAQLPRNSRPRG